MALEDRKLWAQIAHSLPTKINDNVNGPVRGGKYGELYVQPVLDKAKAACLEGTYFVAHNPTSDTGVAHTADPTAFNAADSSFLLVKNAHATKDIILDYLTLVCTDPGTGGTIQQIGVYVDDGSVARYSSGGAAVTCVNTNNRDGSATSALVYSGAIVDATNAGNSKRMFARVLRNVIPVADDQYSIVFGGSPGNAVSAAHAVAGTAILHRTDYAPPVVAGPGQWISIQLVRASQSAAASWEFQLGFIER